MQCTRFLKKKYLDRLNGNVIDSIKCTAVSHVAVICFRRCKMVVNGHYLDSVCGQCQHVIV